VSELKPGCDIGGIFTGCTSECMAGGKKMDICTIESHKHFGLTVLALPAKLLVRSPLAPDCDFELRVERDITSEEWDALFEYLRVCRRQADRKKLDEVPAVESK
jgi:hypothetical protein